MLRDRPNIVLITVDSLRVDRLGCYGYRRMTTRNLDRFAANSNLFLKAFSAGPNTPHAFPAIMAGRSALQSRRLGLFDDDLSLAEVLQENGYTTVGFNAANPYVSRFFQYDRGFAHFQDFIEYELSDNRRTSSQSSRHGVSIPELDLNHYLISEDSLRRKATLENRINGEIFEVLDDIAEPFFVWVHYMDPHYPYVPQPGHQQTLGFEPIPRDENLRLNTRVRENLEVSPEQLERIGQLYDASICQLDSKVADFFTFLKNKNLYDDSLIVFTADHGEEFLEHGGLQHKSKLYDELLHVPLLIKLPRQLSGAVHNRITSLLHLPSTILSAAGMASPFAPPSVFREWKTSEPNAGIFSEASYTSEDMPPVDNTMYNIDPLPKRTCLRTPQWKLILDSETRDPMLFNLLDDPYETRPLQPKQNPAACTFIDILHQRTNVLELSRVKQQVSLIRRKVIHKPNPDHAVRISS